ncbi:arsenate reductase ArsC [Sanguibacter antarcticus]|uniref:Protein-tyrosine-phosphatase n=1 Tax=Sanguibacter antarcticus TaxID=372484 RepID=A0A2A9E667_9MICO|nr:arsenate reductase ArsC [Sanguibacter antarcticus]PFG34458.1 protein-tyrosine-phosphatase [Sanguibacter antarcticus]
MTDAATTTTSSSATEQPRPSVLFVCVHNAGRSQMAAGFLRDLSGGAVEVRSAGSVPADQINPTAVEAMLELGIDIRAESPKVLTPEAVQASDAVITMGCGDVCPVFPGKRYEDWSLEDPAGQGIESVRPIRDEIRRRIVVLLDELGVPVVVKGADV